MFWRFQTLTYRLTLQILSMLTDRCCLACDEPLRGRADKKYCDDDCRNTFNNQRNRDKNALMRNVNGILRKNRTILKGLYESGRTKVHEKKLLESGFRFSYFTNIYQTRSGKMYNFCYEQGILHVGNDYYTIVERKEFVE